MQKRFLSLITVSMALMFIAALSPSSVWAVARADDKGPQAVEEEVSEARNVKFKRNHVLVMFKKGVSKAKKDGIHKKHKGRKIKGYRHLDVDLVELDETMSVEEALERYKEETDVEYAEPDYLVTIEAVPNDPMLGDLWGMANSGQTGGTPGADIMATEAWDISTGDPNVVITVIDTGIDYTHPDLAANLWTNPNEIPGNGIDDDANGYIDDIHGINTIGDHGDPMDDNGHGTHCSGTIGAAGNNSVGVAGVNWNVQIMGCKFLGSTGSGYISDAVECMDYVSTMKNAGVNIVATSNSWGGGSYSSPMYTALQNHMAEDILFIAAAGNGYQDTDSRTYYPQGYNVPNVISVAATDHNDAKADFSNWGRKSVDLAAPGVDIVSTFLPYGNLDASCNDLDGDGYGPCSGTSMATPHVSGVVGLLKAADPSRNWLSIRNLLLSASEPIPAMEGMSVSGGRLNAYTSLSCTNSPLLAAVTFPGVPYAGGLYQVAALSINCDGIVGPVTATGSISGTTVNLHDDGVHPDYYAGDGVFSGYWTAAASYEQLTFSSPAGTDVYTPPLHITTTSMGGAVVDRPYSATLEAASGVEPYTWSISSGSLPAGLTLDPATGVISGACAYETATSITVMVTDSASATATRYFTFIVNPPLSITTTGPLYSTVGVYGSQSLKGKGGSSSSAYSWDIVNGSLPPGLSLSSNGTISGTPTLAGSYTFTAQLTDGVDVVTASIPMEAEIVSITTNALAATSAGEPYSAQLTAAGGTGPYVWSALGGLPAGLGLDSATGLISGTPLASGHFDVAVQVTDAGLNTSTRTLALAVYEPMDELWATTWESTNGRANYPRAIASDESGNVFVFGRYYLATSDPIFAVAYDAAGNLLWENTNLPTNSCCPAAFEGASDDYGNVYVIAHGLRATYIHKINAMDGTLIDYNYVYFSTGVWYSRDGALATDPEGNVYAALDDGADMLLLKYDANFAPVWSVKYDVGSLEVPHGIAIDEYGQVYVQGTDTNGTMFILKYNAEDGALVWERNHAVPGKTLDKGGIAYDGLGGIYVGATASDAYRDIVLIKYDIDGNTLSTETIDENYANDHIDDLKADPSGNIYIAGSIIRKIDSEGGVDFTIPGYLSIYGKVCMDVKNGQVSLINRGYDREISAWHNTYLRIDNSGQLPDGDTDQPYSYTFTASDGTAPLTWSLISGNLPAGLSLDGNTGVLSGTPLSGGFFDIVVGVTDANGNNDAQPSSLYIAWPNTIVIDKAIYTAKKSELFVTATSDNGETANLSVDGLGPMTWQTDNLYWELKLTPIAPEDVPATVTVTGWEGSVTAPVIIK